MDTRELAAAVKDPIGALGGGFMTSREAKAYGKAVGLTGWAPYMRGRGGVLGEVDADVVRAVLAFFPAGTVRQAWEAGRSLPAAEGARRFAEVCQDFGRRKLAGLGDTDARRLADLLERAAFTADVTGAPLFAGWRAMPLPGDSRARVSQLAHVLRELRGAMHAIAVSSVGLCPLEAVVTDVHPSAASSPIKPTDGVAIAQFFGWPAPYPEPTPQQIQLRAQAEELTDRLTAPAFTAFDAGESAELVALLTTACTTAFPAP